jgi:hypothetical protein
MKARKKNKKILGIKMGQHLFSLVLTIFTSQFFFQSSSSPASFATK